MSWPTLVSRRSISFGSQLRTVCLVSRSRLTTWISYRPNRHSARINIFYMENLRCDELFFARLFFDLGNLWTQTNNVLVTARWVAAWRAIFIIFSNMFWISLFSFLETLFSRTVTRARRDDSNLFFILLTVGKFVNIFGESILLRLHEILLRKRTRATALAAVSTGTPSVVLIGRTMFFCFGLGIAEFGAPIIGVLVQVEFPHWGYMARRDDNGGHTGRPLFAVVGGKRERRRSAARFSSAWKGFEYSEIITPVTISAVRLLLQSNESCRMFVEALPRLKASISVFCHFFE